ncbi:MAG: hypothetical protein WCK01_00655 [Candidatus Uhrbacteria bacterium]
MKFENNKNTNSDIMDDLNNEEVVYRILEKGSADEMSRLAKHMFENSKGRITQNIVENFRDLAQQRRRLINRSHEECHHRETHSPEASELEYVVGAYKERIEPQAREAVFALREKGYASFESGFSGLTKQQITFHDPIPELADIKLSKEILDEFSKHDATPYIRPNAIGFNSEHLLSDDTLAHLTNLLVNTVPSLERPQPITEVPTAQLFRERQDKKFPKTKDNS